MNDWHYLESYVRNGSESAFQALVERHAGMVYASALRQVRDPQLAEDVAQAVFMLLARKARGLRRGTVLSGWLFQTARFVAARALRSEQRRGRREQEAFDMQQLSLSNDAWQRMAPVLDEALDLLGRADRNAILLRYFEGRTLREVGASLGITEEAAKKRVVRAVDRLRETLARKGPALSAAAIASALSGHAAAAPPAPLITAWSANALATAAASSTARALMQETLAVWQWAKVKCLAGLGTVATATAVILLASVSPPGRSPGLDPTVMENGEATGPPAAAAPAAQAKATASRGDRNLRHLRLQVLSAEDGEPVANARAVLSVWRLQSVEELRHLTTDPTGVCDVAFEPDAGRIDVGVLENGWSAHYVTWPSEGSSEIPAAYVLRLTRVTNDVGGTILDPSGRPLAGAAVWFQGHESGDSSHRERPRERFGFIGPVPVATTDATGRWAMAIIPHAHRGFQLEARHPDFADTDLARSPGQASLDELSTAELKLLWSGQLRTTMQAALSLTGTVVDEQGRPITGAKVQERSPGAIFLTDAMGQFRVPKLKEGSWSFTVTAAGFAPWRTNTLISPAMLPVVLTLRPGAVLRVRVVDETGRPVPDAVVGLEQWGEHRHDFEWRAQSNSDGCLEWASAPPEVNLELFARKEGYCYTRDVRVKADGSEHTIVLQHALEVFGRVSDAVSGRGVPDFRATPGYGASDRFFDSGLRWYGSETVRGTNGMFRLVFAENVRPWQLRLTAEGFEDWISEPLTNTSRVALDIAMRPVQPTEAVRGVVLLPDGTPAVDAQVALLTFEHNVTLRKQAFEGNARWMAKTDERGAFVFPVNRLAHSVAAVNATGYAHQRVPDPREPIVLRLASWGRVEGVVDESAAMFGVANVRLYDPAADNHQGRVSLLSSYAAEPNANREFVFEHVPPGEFCVFVNSLNNVPFHHQTPLVVRPGETARVVIQERPGTRVTGRFVAPANRALDWSKDFVVSQLYADLPPASKYLNHGPPEERAQRELDFWTSPAGREHVNTRRVYAVMVRGDGSFVSLENLPAGDYRFTTVFKGCSATRQITVGEAQPEMLPLGDMALE